MKSMQVGNQDNSGNRLGDQSHIIEPAEGDMFQKRRESKTASAIRRLSTSIRMSGPSPDSKETGSENEEGDELDSFLLQNEKISILNAWAKDQLANDGKVIDWSKESTFFGLTFQLKNSMLRNYYPEMPQVVRIFWSFLCTARFFDSINIILTAPANEILLKQLGHEEWEAAITATVSGYPSEQGDELPINATAKQKCADKLLRNLINLVPKNLSPDVWDKGSLLTAKIGTGRAFSLLAAADKITLRPAYMLRVAADSNHWEILNKIMGLSLLEGQQYRAMMYRSLYMLQKAVAGNQNHIVNQIMSEWRNDETTSFIEKWRIACEMASGRGNLAFLQMLFQKREFGETELAGASLNMLSLALQGKYFSVVEFLLKEPAKADKFFLSKITQGPTIYKSLILAFAETTHEEIEREMKETGGFGSSSTVEAIALEANAIRFALSRPGVSKTDPSIIDALQRTYTKGNHEIGQIAQDLDISFAWMEPSASTLTRKSWKTTLEKPKKPQAQEDGSMAEYSAMISALGLVDSEMISNADFEKFVKSVETGKSKVLSRRGSIARKASISRNPRVLVDTADNAWSEYLSGKELTDGQSASWMESNYASPVHQYDTATEEPDENLSDQSVFFRMLGGI